MKYRSIHYLKYFALLGVLLLPLTYSQAQVSFGVGIGVGPGYVTAAPVCSYGYYPDYPYSCAPYGYYGPSWFSGGVFIGAGPWYRGYGHPYYGRPIYRGGYGGGYYGGGYYGRGPIPNRGFDNHQSYVGRGNSGYSGHGFDGRSGGGNIHGGYNGGGGSHGGRR